MNNAAAFHVLLLLGAYTTGTTALLCVAWLTTRLFRRNAAMRHLIWLTAFSVVLLAPLGALVTPAGFVLRASLPAPLPIPVKTANVLSDAPVWRKVDQPLLSVGSGNSLRPVLALAPPAPQASTKAAVLRTLATVLDSRNHRARILLGVLGLWGGGVVYVTVQLLASLWGVRNLHRRSIAVSMNLDALSQRAGLQRQWELRISNSSNLPTAMTWGAWHPVVLLPRESLSWSEAQLEAVLLHELAHVRRYDSVSQIIALCMCALHWFNPLVWWGAQNFRAQAEMAADDAVLRGGVKASTYAGDLLALALAAQKQGQTQQLCPSMIAVPLLRRSCMENRIQYIVSPGFCRQSASTAQLLAVAGVSLCLMAFSCSVRPAVSVHFDSRAANTGLTLALVRPQGQRRAPSLQVRIKRVLRHTEEVARRNGPRRLRQLAANRISGLLRYPHNRP